MKILSCISLLLSFAFVYGTLCRDLSGTWRNQLGSNMTIVRISDSEYKITGQYNTSVESSTGAATLSSPIAGIVKPVDRGSLIAFNVLWNKGASLTAWVGQCMVCDEQERIFTSWVLRSLMSPYRKWMTTRVNQDTFWRLDVPNEELQVQPLTGENIIDLELPGMWTSTSTDAFNLTIAPQHGNLEGLHLTPGKDEDPVPLFGTVDGNATHIALGFTSAGPTRIRGWTGHIYNPDQTDNIMETSWLTHAFSDNCDIPRRFVQFGMDNYTQIASDVAPGA